MFKRQKGVNAENPVKSRRNFKLFSDMFKLHQERNAETAVKTASLFRKFLRVGSMCAMFIVAIGLFNACGKDDGGGGSSSSLVGKWDWAEEHCTFTFTADGKWSVFDYKYNEEEDSGTYTFDGKVINLTYIPATNEPIWGRRWELRNDISSTLKAEVYDEDGYQGTMTLTKK